MRQTVVYTGTSCLYHLQLSYLHRHHHPPPHLARRPLEYLVLMMTWMILERCVAVATLPSRQPVRTRQARAVDRRWRLCLTNHTRLPRMGGEARRHGAPAAITAAAASPQAIAPYLHVCRHRCPHRRRRLHRKRTKTLTRTYSLGTADPVGAPTAQGLPPLCLQRPQWLRQRQRRRRMKTQMRTYSLGMADRARVWLHQLLQRSLQHQLLYQDWR